MKSLKVSIASVCSMLMLGCSNVESKTLVSLAKDNMHPKVVCSDTKIIDWIDDGVVVRAGGKDTWPSIAFRAVSKPWDFTKYHTIKVDLTNAGSTPAYLGFRLDNYYKEKKDAPQHAQGFELFQPSETRTMTVRLNTEPWVFKESFPLYGMRRAPGVNLMDIAKIDRIKVFAGHVKDPITFIVRNLRVEGHVEERESAGFLPLIDKYGQYRHREWAAKTKSDADLKKAREDEKKDIAANPGPTDRSKFGGWKNGPKLKATGYFRVEKVDGKWWFVDPQGYLYWSVGPTCINTEFGYTGVQGRENYFEGLPAANDALAQFYSECTWAPHGFYKDKVPFKMFRFFQANLYRKYGANWEDTFFDIVHDRLKSWGMTSVANWATPAMYLKKRTPYTANFWVRGNRTLDASNGYWSKFHDVFDPSFREAVKKGLSKRTEEAKDPWCIGFFVDNELSWGNDGISLALETLGCPADQPAKKVFVADLKSKYRTIDKLNLAWGTNHVSWSALAASTETPDVVRAKADLKQFYAKTADAYFKIIDEELVVGAPNHLYLGCRFAWVNDIVAHASAQYCDVVSYNKYNFSVRNLNLPDYLDRPLIIGEFHFGATDRGHFHPGLREGKDQAERANMFETYVKSGLDNPQLVGVHWFQFVDEMASGRADEENYNVGLVDVCDTPYPEMVDSMRSVGKILYSYRANGK